MGISKSLCGAAVAAILTLTACGGSNPSVTQNPSTNASCELTLKYADGLNGGYAIHATPVDSVTRQFNTCAITHIQSASLSLCLDHRQISELSAQLILPNHSARPLDLLNARATGSDCLLTGKLFALDLTAADIQPFSGLQGDWSVRVTDTNQVSATPLGYLVGWSMKVEGTK